MSGDHNQLPEKEKLEVHEFREKVKQRSINETTPIPRIYDEESAKVILSNATIAVLTSERETNLKILLFCTEFQLLIFHFKTVESTKHVEVLHLQFHQHSYLIYLILYKNNA